ncbi:MAG: 4Fe-4S binding protein [Euryarchaeota archaeon]|nr:4Fe-4S binding protein [Euryarchaeota archaeon]
MIPTAMIVSLGYALILILIMGILLKKGIVGKRIVTAVTLMTLMVGGLLLGGVPDPVSQFLQIFRGLALGNVPIIPVIGLSLLIVITLIAGRLFCGYACPLGAVQELMSRCTEQKISMDKLHPRWIRGIFTIVVAVVAFFVPFVTLVNPFRFFDLQFIPVVTIIFVGVAIISIFIYRPWCQLLCPFGAISELASRYSIFRLRRKPECIDCDQCVRVCPTNQPVPRGSMSECYLCGRCIDACPKDSLAYSRKDA